MKKEIIILILLPFVYTHAQWTAPRQIDSTVSTLQHDPLVAIGPNRELVIVCTESSQYGRLVGYKSTDLGAAFTRTVIAEGGFQPPWTYWTAGEPASLGFDNSGAAFLLSHYLIIQDFLAFSSNYVLSRMEEGGLHFTSVWNTRGPGGTLESTLGHPAMSGGDTVLCVLSDDRSWSSDCIFLMTTLSGDSMDVVQQDTIVTLPMGFFDADLERSQAAIHFAISASDAQERHRLFFSRRLHQDSTFSPLLPVDTNYATSPHIADLGSGTMLLLYAAGSGFPYSDSLLTGRVFTDGSTTLSPPFRLAAKPIRPRVANANRPSTMHTMETDHHLVYRSYSSTTPLVAYYQFADVQSPPLDSAFFTGYDYGDLALDSLGGKYLVMIGPDGRVYLSKKDVVSGVRNPPPIPTAFALEQNYPNPFNPRTVIKFQIQSSTLVTLSVYDVLGREVATLVNEVKHAGAYQVTWDAGEQASGVYFYRLQAGAFVETKKMVVMR